MHLRLHEHETRRYEWTERDLRAIVRLNQGAGAELIRAVVDVQGHKCLRAFQHVGVYDWHRVELCISYPKSIERAAM